MNECCNDACLHVDMDEGRDVVFHVAATIAKDEEQRQENEKVRQANEAKRQETYNTLKTQAENDVKILKANNEKFSEITKQYEAINQSFRTEVGTDIAYAVSTSGTTPPTKEWKTVPIACPPGSWLWTRTTIHYNKGADTVAYAVAYEGRDGANGVNTPLNTLTYLYSDTDGNLYALYNDGDLPPGYEYDKSTGDLYAVFEY